MSGGAVTPTVEHIPEIVRTTVKNVWRAAIRAQLRAGHDAIDSRAYALRQAKLDLERRIRRSVKRQGELQEEFTEAASRLRRMDMAAGSRCATQAGEQGFEFARTEHEADLSRINYSLMMLREDDRRSRVAIREMVDRDDKACKRIEAKLSVWLDLLVMFSDQKTSVKVRI